MKTRTRRGGKQRRNRKTKRYHKSFRHRRRTRNMRRGKRGGGETWDYFKTATDKFNKYKYADPRTKWITPRYSRIYLPIYRKVAQLLMMSKVENQDMLVEGNSEDWQKIRDWRKANQANAQKIIEYADQ